MTYQIGQIPTHYPSPGGAYKIEVENPTGPVSGYSTITEILTGAGLAGRTSFIFSSNTSIEQQTSVANIKGLVNTNIPAGSTILVFAAESATSSGGTLTDSAGNTYTALITKNPNNAAANGFLTIWTCENCLQVNAPGWINYAPKTVGDNAVVYALAYNKPTSTCAHDPAVTASATGTTSAVSVTSGVPASANTIFIGVALASGANAGGYGVGQVSGDFSNSATSSNFATAYGLGVTNFFMDIYQFTNTGTSTKTLTVTSSGSAAPWCGIIIGIEP